MLIKILQHLLTQLVYRKICTSVLKLVPVELSELAEESVLVFESDSRAAVRHIHPEHAQRPIDGLHIIDNQSKRTSELNETHLPINITLLREVNLLVIIEDKDAIVN